jgi:hypothetical protein
MKRLFFVKRFSVLIIPLLILLVTSASAQHGWPIEPSSSIEHPIGNSFGEYQFFWASYYMHTGIDILGMPKYQSDQITEDENAPWVLVAVSGTVADVHMEKEEGPYYNYVTIIGQDGVTYGYWHLEYDSFMPDFALSSNSGKSVNAGDKIAKLVRFDYIDCEFHHLHYQLESNNNYLNPLAGITPHQDKTPPEIAGIFFAEDNSNTGDYFTWKELPEDPQRACTVVSGKVDIIVQYRDRDAAGSTDIGTETLGVFNLLWRACPDSNPNCPWQNTRAFDNMPMTWGSDGLDRAEEASTSFYSTNSPWKSDSTFCKATYLYAIVTNFIGDTPDRRGTWDTTTVCNGTYTVSVKAIDFAGNETSYQKKACVQNGPNMPDCPNSPGSSKNLRILDPD